jgi:hypothetical protein
MEMDCVLMEKGKMEWILALGWVNGMLISGFVNYNVTIIDSEKGLMFQNEMNFCISYYSKCVI